MRKKKYSNQNVDNYYSSLEKGASPENLFSQSLSDMTPEDFLGGESQAVISEKQKKKKRNASNAVSNVFILLFGLCFMFCLYKIVDILAQYRTADKIYDVIADDFAGALAAAEEKMAIGLPRDAHGAPMQSFEQIKTQGAVIYEPSKGVDKLSSSRFMQMLVKLEELKDNNQDTFGYISVPGTKVSYPLVKGNDNEYYLKHSFTGTTLKAGAIFVDFRNSFSLSDNKNTVIYGHNMENGAMFHSVLKYLEEDFFRSTDLTIYTFDGIFTYEIFSIYETTADDDYFRVWFSGDSDFVEFCKDEERQSKFHKEGIEFGPDSRIITLSTCISGVTDGRYAIHGILKSIER